MDRALGCTYPEDRKKTDKHIIEFSEGSSMEELKLCLKAGPQNWQYGEIPDEFFFKLIFGRIKIVSQPQAAVWRNNRKYVFTRLLGYGFDRKKTSRTEKIS